MHARRSSFAFGLVLFAACTPDPAPASDETESDTGEPPSCLDSDTPGPDIIINFDSQIEELALGECVAERIVITGGGVTDISGLANLREVGILEIRYLPILDSLAGLEQLERVDSLIITGNGALTELPTFGALAQLGNVTITSNDVLADLGSFPLATTVNRLEISSNPSLTDYSGFEALTATTSDLELWDAALIEDLTGFEALTTVGGGLRIEDMLVLSSLTGLGVETIGGDLRIISNPQLSECLAADFVEAVEVGGAIIVNTNEPDAC